MLSPILPFSYSGDQHCPSRFFPRKADSVVDRECHPGESLPGVTLTLLCYFRRTIFLEIDCPS